MFSLWFLLDCSHSSAILWDLWEWIFHWWWRVRSSSCPLWLALVCALGMEVDDCMWELNGWTTDLLSPLWNSRDLGRAKVLYANNQFPIKFHVHLERITAMCLLATSYDGIYNVPVGFSELFHLLMWPWIWGGMCIVSRATQPSGRTVVVIGVDGCWWC